MIHNHLQKIAANAAFFVLAGLWCGVSIASSSELRLTVVPDGAAVASGLPVCATVPASDCRARLGGVVALVQSKAWQAALPKGVKTVRLVLQPGVYRLAAPLSLTWGNGATAGVALEISGPGARLNGATVLALSAGATDARLPAAARPLVLQADLPVPEVALPPRGFGLPIRPVAGELFFQGRAMPVAQWPNAGYGRVVRSGNLPADDKRSFAVEGRSAAEWADEPDLRVFAYWFHDWAAQTYAVRPAAGMSNLLAIEGAGSPYGIKQGQRLRVENALRELDAPGEWVADRPSRRLYWWPTGPVGAGEAEYSVAESLLVIDSARQVTVRDLTFEKTRGDAVVVRNSEKVVLDGVTIRLTGNRAVVVSGGADCGVRNALIEDNGDGGASLAGGDRITLAPARHFVEGSAIRRFSRLAKTYRFAVEMNGVGQLAVGNTISDAPHCAIQFLGNEHRIAGNEIFEVVKETGDAGAIYVGRDFTSRGTVIEDNFLHDIQPDAGAREVKGVYLDDQASGIVIRRNVFARVQQPVFIGGGRDNVVEDNVFYESSPAVHLDARGLNWQRAATLDPKRELQSRLDAVPYRGALYAARYPNLPKIRDDEIGAPKYNVARRNVVVKGKPTHIDREAEPGIAVESMRVVGEEVFATPVPPGGRRTREAFLLK